MQIFFIFLVMRHFTAFNWEGDGALLLNKYDWIIPLNNHNFSSVTQYFFIFTLSNLSLMFNTIHATISIHVVFNDNCFGGKSQLASILALKKLPLQFKLQPMIIYIEVEIKRGICLTNAILSTYSIFHLYCVYTAELQEWLQHRCIIEHTNLLFYTYCICIVRSENLFKKLLK